VETEQSNKVNTVLRWFGFFPVAVVAAWLAELVVYPLGLFSLGWAGITPEKFPGKLYFATMPHLAMGAAFVYVGAKIAPAHKVAVAFILGLIGVAFSGALLFAAVMVRDWWAVWGGLFVAIGAGAVVWTVSVEETNLG